MTSADVKAELRRHALARRDLISPREAHDAAAHVCVHALELIRGLVTAQPRPVEIVSLYWPIRSELNTRPLLEALAAKGMVTALPVMSAVKQPLAFRAFSPGDELVKGPFGLSEPANGKETVEPDIVFAPLAAFDRKGYRLGYGGGIYDATLSALRSRRRIVAVGLAFACQEADAIPIEPHDEKLDYLLTEREVIAFR